MKTIGLRLAAIATAVVLTISLLALWVLPYAVAHTGVLSRLLSSQLGAPVRVEQPELTWQGVHFQLRAKKITVLPAEDSQHPAASWDDIQLSMPKWGRPRLQWQQARLVVGLDADNHPMLGDPQHPVALPSGSGSVTGGWFYPNLSLSWHDTQIQLIKTKKQQTRVMLTLEKASDAWQLQWKLAGQSQWQQASMRQSNGYAQIDISLTHFDLSPLWRVLSQDGTQIGVSDLQLHSHWQQDKGVWHGGWKDFAFQTHWRNQRSHDIRVTQGSAELHDQGSEMTLEMHWPRLHIDDTVVRDVSSQWLHNDYAWHWQAKKINLEKWAPVLQALLNTQQRQSLQAMAPTGMLDSLQLSMTGNKRPAIQLATTFSHLHWNSHQTLPGVRGLSGKVVYDVNNKTAHALLRLQDGRFAWPSQFSATWKQVNFFSNLYAKKTTAGWHVLLDQFDFHDSHLQATAAGTIDIPSQSQPAQFDWKLKFSLPQARYTKHYLPKAMATQTRRWLSRSLQGGSIKQAELMWKGPADKAPFAHQEGTFKLKVPIDNLLLNYSNQWPYLRHATGVVTLDNSALHFQLSKASLLGNPVLHGSGDMPDVHHPVLSLQAEFHTQLPAIKTFVEATPMPWKHDLKPLTLKGPVQVKMQFVDDMVHDKQTVNGTLKLKNNRISLRDRGLSFTQLGGSIHFTEQGLSGENLKASLFRSPVALQLKTQQQNNHSTLLMLDVAGQVVMKHWQKHTLPALRYLQGKTTYQAHLLYDGIKGSQQNKLTIDSGLQGIKVELPYPLQKAQQATLPTHLQADLTPGKPAQVAVQYGKTAQAIFQFQQSKGKTRLKKGVIHIGSHKPTWPKESGLTLLGLVDHLDGKRWAPVLSELNAGDQPASSKLWTAAHLEISHFYWGDMALSRAYLSAHPDDASWLFDLKSEYGLINVRLPNDRKQPIAMRFHQFDWKPLFQKSQPAVSPDNLKQNWPDIPDVSVACSECRYGKKHLGSVNGVYHEKNGGRHELTSTWEYEGTVLTSTATWGRKHRVRWKGSADIANLAIIEDHLTDTNYIESGRGVVDFDLHWKGGPFDLTTQALAGSMQADLRKVKFIHIPEDIQSSLNYVKMVDALSFENALPIVSTVRSGFYAPHIRFSGNWKNKVFDTADFMLDSPVIDMDAGGQIDFGHKTLNLKAALQPQVTGSLPALATIAGGPVLGVFAYAANKIIEPLVGKAAEHHYQITGPFANVSVKKLDK